MSGVATAVGVGAIGGALISSSATGDAAEMQANAANNAAGLQWQMYQQQREDQAPWRAAGQGALTQMQDPYFQQNFGAQDFQQDPGYQFRLDQGTKALEASAAARGGLMSGNLGKGLADYSQNFASNEYQNAYNRFTNNQTNRYNRLASLAGLGQNANAQMGQAAANYGNNMGNIMTGSANAQGAAAIANGQTWGNAVSGLGNNWMQMSMMNRLAPKQPQTYSSIEDY